TYTEYAGGMLRADHESLEHDETAALQAELNEAIGDAASLLVFLDGAKIKSYLSSEGMSDAEFNEWMLPIYLRVENWRTGGPVHFVITKWDLLSKSRHDYAALVLIHEKLLKNIRFREMLEGRGSWSGERSLVRLIPVSSVGHNFMLADGKMKNS